MKEKENILGGIEGVQYAEQTENVSATPEVGGLLMSKNATNNFEDFRSNEVSVEEDVSDSLVRKVKDVGLVSLRNFNSGNKDGGEYKDIKADTSNEPSKKDTSKSGLSFVNNDTETNEIIEGF